MFVQLRAIDHIVGQQADRAILLLGVRATEDDVIRLAEFFALRE